MKNPTANNGCLAQFPLLKFSMLLLAVVVFTGCATPPPGPVVNQTASDKAQAQKIVLREGDVLKIAFPGSANLDTTQQIRRDGKISLPLVGEVQAAGETPDTLQQNLIKLYAPQISSQEVTVSIESSAFPVYVTGCVIRPGKVSSDQPITALEAVMGAGGFDYAKANMKEVRVIRRENGASKSYVLNLKLVMQENDEHPFFLEPNDIVYVPERFVWF
jgi:polysaccharide export outer membrane protein